VTDLSERLAQFEQEYRASPSGFPIDPALADALEQFEKEFAVSSVEKEDRLPATFLQIIGRSGYERFYSKLLAYFLDPNEPHGFGPACLNALFACAELGVEVDDHTAGRVQVFTELSMGRRLADVVVDTGEVALVIENKVYSQELLGQTTDLHKHGDSADFFPGRTKKYIYLTPEGLAPASRALTRLSYRQLIEALEPVMAGLLSRVPASSVLQLGDFLRTIREELMPGEKKAYFGAKSVLYQKHYAAISEAVEAFSEDFKSFARSWPGHLRADCLLDEEEWGIETPGSYFQVYKKGWNPEAGVRVHFEVWPREDVLRDHAVKAMLDVESDRGHLFWLFADSCG